MRTKASSAWTVGELARGAGITRSALLYYDRIGLLRPSNRSASRYRLYGEDARLRLEAIRMYRAVGLGLKEIRDLLDAPQGKAAKILAAQLETLNQQIERLREQQRVIVRLLQDRALLPRTRALDKERWIEILSTSGLNRAAMERWHVQFEALAPEAHQDFLESLGIPRREIALIRRRSRTHGSGA